jgi:hypothetical protein
VVRCSGDVLQVDRREEGGGSDGWGPPGSDVRGNAIVRLRKLEEEAPFGKYANAAQAEWAEHAHCEYPEAIQCLLLWRYTS